MRSIFLLVLFSLSCAGCTAPQSSFSVSAKAEPRAEDIRASHVEVHVTYTITSGGK